MSSKKKAAKRARKLLVPAKRQETLEQTLKRIEKRENRLFVINVLQQARHERGLPPARLS